MSADPGDLCPVCLTRAGFRRERANNLWERWFLPILGKAPFLCLSCGYRQIRALGRAKPLRVRPRPAPVPDPVRLAERRRARPDDEFDRLIATIRQAERAKAAEGTAPRESKPAS